MDDVRERVTTAAGVCSPLVLLAALGSGAALDPGYDWPTEAFSVIGASGGPAATVFNVGVVGGGLVALPFAWRLWTDWHPAPGGLYGLFGFAFVVAGAFPIGTALHDVAAAIFFVAPLLPWTAAVLDWRADRRRGAVAQALLGLAAVAVWIPYDLGIESAQVGYGGAELVAVLVIAVWSVAAAARRWPDRSDAAEPATAAART